MDRMAGRFDKLRVVRDPTAQCSAARIRIHQPIAAEHLRRLRQP